MGKQCCGGRSLRGGLCGDEGPRLLGSMCSAFAQRVLFSCCAEPETEGGAQHGGPLANQDVLANMPLSDWCFPGAHTFP